MADFRTSRQTYEDDRQLASLRLSVVATAHSPAFLHTGLNSSFRTLFLTTPPILPHRQGPGLTYLIAQHCTVEATSDEEPQRHPAPYCRLQLNCRSAACGGLSPTFLLNAVTCHPLWNAPTLTALNFICLSVVPEDGTRALKTRRISILLPQSPISFSGT
jgi:hypothetical protein